MKLDRIQTALKYIQREIPEFSSCSEVFKVLDRISLWKPTFPGEKIHHLKEKAAKEIDTTDEDLRAIQKLVNSEVATTKAQKIVNDNKPSDEDIDFLSTYIFCCLTYKNFQRPEPAINMTVEEASNARYVGDGDDNEKLKIIMSKEFFDLIVHTIRQILLYT